MHAERSTPHVVVLLALWDGDRRACCGAVFDSPGIVACEFVDAEECRHTFIDKVPIFCGDTSLDASSKYPQQGAIRCTVLSRWNDPRGRELLRISTAAPNDAESTGELQEFRWGDPF